MSSMITPIKLLNATFPGKFKHLYTVNSQGYRCPEFETIDWERSILIFGCSNVFGVGASDEATVSSQLQLLVNRPVINLGQGATGYSFNWMNSTILKECGVRPKAVVYIWPEYSRQSIFNSYNYTEQTTLGHWNLSYPNSDRTKVGVALVSDEFQCAAMAYYYSKNVQVLWNCPVLQYTYAARSKPPNSTWIKSMPQGIDHTPVDPTHPGIKTNIERAKQIHADLQTRI